MATFKPSSFSRQFTSLELKDVQLTGKKLGKGSDATVHEVNWLGTLCAAKQLHEILLEDDSPGGARRFIENFEKECMTWSRLVHPCIVQFLGVYFLSSSCVPVLILEKMDTSLRNYLEAHKKEEVPLPDKVYILRQVAQALSYLHSLSPPLVHHDLSPNNVLLNAISLQTKVTDFGMTRALDPFKMTHKSSIKGTQAFMPPEGLVDTPKYNDKLDVFSYGNVIITTITHMWPNPGQPTKLKGKKLIGVSELQRRQQYLDQFTPKESELFLPVVQACLQNDPSERPTSIILVTQMSKIEEDHPRVPDSVVISQLRQTLDDKNIVFDQNVALLHQKDELLGLKDALLHQQDAQLHEKDAQLRMFREEMEQLRQGASLMKKVAEKAPRNWKDIKCQKALKCGERCLSVATKADLIAVGVWGGIKLYSITSNELLCEISHDQLGGALWGVAFLDEQTIVVSDVWKHNLKLFTTKRKLLRTIDRGRTTFKPLGVTVSPDGHIYVCDGANHCVCVFNAKGKSLFSFGSHGSGDECFHWPRDLCFASDGLLSITDVDNSRICVYDKDGKFIRKFPTTCKPTCIDATDCGHLIVSSFASDKVMIYTTGGELVHVFGGYGNGSGQFKSPCGVSVDGHSLIYIGDYNNSCIPVF